MSGLRTNPCLRAMTSVLAENGVPYHVRHGGRHPHLVFTIDGRTRAHAFPATPSDRRSSRNARAQMRRLLKDLTHA